MGILEFKKFLRFFSGHSKGDLKGVRCLLPAESKPQIPKKQGESELGYKE